LATYEKFESDKMHKNNFWIKAEQRADLAERTMAKLQKECDKLEGDYIVISYLNICFFIDFNF